jgi:hypothetical protein
VFEIVAGIDDDAELLRRQDAQQSERKLGATDTSRDCHDGTGTH